MLSAKISKGLYKNPVAIDEIQSLVVFDKYEQPIHVFIVLNDQNVLSASCGDKNFDKILADLGIDKRFDIKVL